MWELIADPNSPERTLRIARVDADGVRYLAWRDGHASHREAAPSSAVRVREQAALTQAGACAPCAGVLVALDVAVGDVVALGQRIGTVEAMKMEFAVLAQADGSVVRLLAELGKPLARHAPVAEIC